jgi:outer membrane protein OmpA-like peptidoglycan-associated protein
LSLSGEVATAEERKALNALLIEHAGLIHYVNDTRVAADPQPATAHPTQTPSAERVSEPSSKAQKAEKGSIAFVLTKKGSVFTLEGTFADIEQIAALQHSLDDAGALYTNGTLKQDETLEGDRVIALTQKLIRPFVAEYVNGSIAYRDRVLTVSGEVLDANDKNMMGRLLAANARGVEYRNATTVVAPVAVSAEEKQAFLSEVGSILGEAKITFQSGSSRLTEEGKAVVERIGKILLAHPHIRVEIAGHTDSDGDDAANLALSQARVDRVRKALIKLGVDPFRLRAKGYGESRPLVSNDSAQNKAKNRRVEFNIIGE